MTIITTEIIKELRDKTGVSVMQCKKALEEAGGDIEKALEVLREIGSAQAEKKADRTLGGGIVHSYIHSNKKVGVLLELNCETDFVAGNEEFVSLANDLVLHIAGMAPDFISETDVPESDKADESYKDRVLLNQPFVKNPDITIEQRINEVIQKTGEKVAVGRFVRYTVLG